MKKIRVFSLLLFAAALAIFGLYHFKKVRLDDNVGPEITMDSRSVTITCEDGEDKMLEGITASDKVDGDVTSSLLVESMSNFIEDGRRNIVIAAFDSSSNVTKVTREVIYSDYHNPTFSLTEPFKFTLNTENLLNYITVNDALDGDITNRIKISPDYTVNTSVAGDYSMKLSVTNSAGDVAELPVTVQIYDPTVEAQVPKFELSDYIIYVSAGTEVNPWDYVYKVKRNNAEYTRAGDGALHGNDTQVITHEEITMDTSTLDTNTPGVYEITYSLSDNVGRIGQSRLIVVVE